MDDFSDWCIVAPVNSFAPTNEKVEEICINTDEENSTESSSSENDSSNPNRDDVKKNSFSALSHEKGVTEICLKPFTTNIDEAYVSSPHDYSVRIVAANSKNLWVSGLTEMTGANDLKALFSKYGEVSSISIIKSTKTSRTCYYGLVTMSSSEEAVACIEKLNHAKLHGPTITTEKTTMEPSESIKGSDLKNMQSEAPPNKSEKSVESPKDVTSILSELPNLVISTSSYTRCPESTRHQSLNESSEKFSKTCHLKTEKMPRKQDAESSTNSGLQDISSTDSSGTSDQRKLDVNTDEVFHLLGVRKVNYRDQDTFSFLPFRFQEDGFSTVLYIFCCICVFFILDITGNLTKPSEIASLNDTIIALQRENFLLKRQISFNQRKENRKLTCLSNLVSIKFEEKENVTRKYLQQLELETLHLKEINSLKEKVSSLEAKYKILQNHFTESSSIVKETGENYEKLPDSSSNIEEHDNVKSKSCKVISELCSNLLTFALPVFLLWVLCCFTVRSEFSPTRRRDYI